MTPHSDYVVFVHAPNGDLETVLGPFGTYPEPVIRSVEADGNKVQVVQRLHTVTYVSGDFQPSPVGEAA